MEYCWSSTKWKEFKAKNLKISSDFQFIFLNFQKLFESHFVILKTIIIFTSSTQILRFSSLSSSIAKRTHFMKFPQLSFKAKHGKHIFSMKKWERNEMIVFIIEKNLFQLSLKSHSREKKRNVVRLPNLHFLLALISHNNLFFSWKLLEKILWFIDNDSNA